MNIMIAYFLEAHKRVFTVDSFEGRSVLLREKGGVAHRFDSLDKSSAQKIRRELKAKNKERSDRKPAKTHARDPR